MNVPSSAHFISREAELSRLREVIAGAADRRPRTVIIGGDAGVGKTRLLREALAGADARVLAGGCVDVAEDSLPYAPFAEALRGLADELEPHDVEGAPLSATAQARMYERLLGLLRRLGEEAPVVLAIEDLHWADRSTRDLLRFLAGNLRGERLAILATYRADDLHRGHPLRPLVAELERGGWAERLHLRPFTRAEVAEQIAAILGEPPAPAFVSEVFERAEGNAFCVEQLVATAREGGGRRLPSLLEDVLHARFERLSAPAQRLLGVVAAGGPRVREALIAAVCGLPDDERDASLRDAVDHQILAVEGDAYVFRHALLREAAYAHLLPGERHRLHAAYGAALGARPELAADAAAVDAELARHWHAADELGPALAASVAAAAAAERRHGYAEASAHYARALEVWPRVDGPATAAGTCLVALLRRAAEVANLAGESTRAAELIRAALDEIDVPEIAGELHERLGRYLWAAGDSEAATGAYEEAVRLVPAAAALARPRPGARGLGPGADAALALRRVARALRGGDRDRALGRRPARGGPRPQHARRRPRLPRRPGHGRRPPAGGAGDRRGGRRPRRPGARLPQSGRDPRRAARPPRGGGRDRARRHRAVRGGRARLRLRRLAAGDRRPARCSSSDAGTRPRRWSPTPPSEARSSARRSTSTWRARRSRSGEGRSPPPNATWPPSAS